MPMRDGVKPSVMSEQRMLMRPVCATVVSRSILAPSNGGMIHSHASAPCSKPGSWRMFVRSA